MTLKPFTRLACALLLALPAAAYAESGDTPPPPERNPTRAEAPADEHPVLPGDGPTVAWTDGEVEAAKADCAKLLAGVALEYEPLPPLKEGICGAPAPIVGMASAAVATAVANRIPTVFFIWAISLSVGWLVVVGAVARVPRREP